MGQSLPIIAVDIGNSRSKLGLFTTFADDSLPQPDRMISLAADWQGAELDKWLAAEPAAFDWRIASVNRPATERMIEWLAKRGADVVCLLDLADAPIAVEVDEPDQVGIDRLANSLAANRLRDPKRGAIVVDLGSAITLDVISPAGAFVGGAILPGIGMSARALHEFTDQLPLEPMTELATPPAPLGKTTSSCLQSGLYWGAIGGVRGLVWRLSETIERPQLFITGGAGPAAAQLLTDSQGEPAVLVPHLTLAGITLMH